MADTKISGLPASTVPLAGTEVLPIVQSSTTKKVSIANVTAGRAVSALSFAPTGSALPTDGLFLPAVNAVGLATNSEERLRVSATGGVSIGNTVDPGATNLSVTGVATAAGFILSSSGIITEATTARTLSAGDNGKVIYCTSASATTITCAASLGAGFSVTIMQGGAGKVTVAAGAATLVSYSSLFSTMGQYAVISLIAPVANTFIAAGNLGV
jgi:hypothetical protein